MAVYIGVDLHVRTQTVCWMDTADGELHERVLDHERDDVAAFYAQFPPGASNRSRSSSPSPAVSHRPKKSLSTKCP
jgi:hypothetical protein